jgi:hypothetical protein
MTVIFIIIILLVIWYTRRKKEECPKKADCTCRVSKTINAESKMLKDNVFDISVTMQDPSVDSFADMRSFETPESLYSKSLTVANIDGPFMSGIVAPLDSFEKGYEYMIGV